MTQKPVSPQDYFDLMQKMANPGGQAFQGLFFSPLDVKEVEKKIAELKSVEHWLKANLGMLQLSIQTLEYQRTLLTPAKETAKDAAKAAAPGAADPSANPALWAWQMMNQATEQFQAAAQEAMKPQVPKAKAAAAKRRKA